MPLLIDGFYSRSVPSVQWDEEQQSYVVAVDEESEKEQQRMNAWNLVAVDFIYLALVTKCEDVVLDCSMSTHTIMFVSFILTIMFTTRLWFDDYFNRFYENDVFHRVLFFAYALCSFVMVLNVNSVYTNGHPSDSSCRADLYGVAFGGGFLATRFIMLIFYASVVLSDRKLQALRQFWGHMVAISLSGFIAFSLLMVEYSTPEKVKPAERINTYIACMVIEFTYHTWHHYSLAFASFLRNINCPCNWLLAGKEVYVLNIPQYQDRIGSFVMIILGEVLIKNLVRYYDIAYEEETYGYSVASMIIVFFYGLLYYDATKAEGDHHALTHSILSSYLYIWFHLLLAIACFFTNASIGVFFELSMPTLEVITVEEEEPSDDKALMFESTHKPIFTASTLLGTSMGITLIMFALINLLHRGMSQLCGKGEVAIRRDLAFKLFIAIMHFSVPGFQLKDGIHEVAVHTTLLALAVFFEIRFPRSPAMEDSVENGKTVEVGDGDKEASDDDEHGEGKVEGRRDDDVIPRSRYRRQVRMRNDFEYSDEHMYRGESRRGRQPSSSRGVEERDRDRDRDKDRDRGRIREREKDPIVHPEDPGLEQISFVQAHSPPRADEEQSSDAGSGVQNIDRRRASRRQSVQIQAEAASPKDAHLMTIAAPKTNPLDRRGSVLGPRTPGGYQDSVDRRKSRISALAVSAEKVHSQSLRNPMHAGSSV